MELDFKNYDIVNSKEKEIEKIIKKPSRITNIPELAQHINKNEDILMVGTLMSIMFKSRSKSIYMMNRIEENKELEQDTIFMTEEIIKMIYITLNRKGIKGIRRVLLENASVINEELLNYFAEKNTNYIEKKFFIETILKQHSQKEILTLNPFMINQLLDYQQKPLTFEENIIQETIDYFLELNQYYDSPQDIEHVKKLLKKNNSENYKMERIILFMLSNVYQESKEKKDYNFHSLIARIVEDTNISPSNMIRFLNFNQSLVTQIINKFIEYNINIEEGRIEELEKKSSSSFAKRIYRKNP